MTIGTENGDFCLTLGARCVALGLYVMLYGHESCGVLFLKSDSPENFGHTTNAAMRLICFHSKCYLLCIKAFSIDFLCRAWHFLSGGLKDGFTAEKILFLRTDLLQKLKNPQIFNLRVFDDINEF